MRVELLDAETIAVAEGAAVLTADGAAVDVTLDETGTAVVTGMYQTLPLADADAVRLVGRDWPLLRVVVMVETTVVEAGADADELAGLVAVLLETLSDGDGRSCARHPWKASRPRPSKALVWSLNSILKIDDLATVTERLCFSRPS